MKQILLAVTLLTSLISNAGTSIFTKEKGDHICYYVDENEKGSYVNIIAISCVDKKVNSKKQEVNSKDIDGLSYQVERIIAEMGLQGYKLEIQLKKIIDVLTDINVNIQTNNKKK